MNRKTFVTISLLTLTILFALLAFEISREESIIAEADKAITDHIASIRTANLTTFFTHIEDLGGGWITLSGAIVITVIFAFFKRWAAMTGYLWVVISGAAFNSFLKSIFDRTRPAENAVMNLSSSSFPSGHAVNAVLLYGGAVYFLWPVIKNIYARTLLLALSVPLITLIGLSRIYLGVHWTSDVIGGFLFGGIWLTVIFSTRIGLNKTEN